MNLNFGSLSGGIPGVPSTTVWIDGNRTDSYTPDGTINKPYKTIQAAVDAEKSLVEGGGYVSFVVAPGDYAEDVVWPSVTITGGAGWMSIAGYGIEQVTSIRSLVLNPPATGDTLHATLTDVTLGAVGTQTSSALSIPATGGHMFCRMYDSFIIGTVDSAIDTVDIASGSGNLTFAFDNLQVSQSGGTGDASGLSAGRGSIFGRGEWNGRGGPAVALSGGANFTLHASNVVVTSGAGAVDAITHTGTGTVTLGGDCALYPLAAGHGVNHTGVPGSGVGITAGDTSIITGDGTGGFVCAGGAVIIGTVSNVASGVAFPTVTAAAILRGALAESEGYIPADVGDWGGSAPDSVKHALDQLAANTSTVSSLFRQMQATQYGEIAPNANVAQGDVYGTGLLDGNNLQGDGGNRSDVEADGKYVELDKSNLQQEVYVVASANTSSPSGNPVTSPELLPIFGAKIKALQLDDSRIFIGMSGELTMTASGFIGADAPLSDYIGFQFSGTGLRGDTNWQLVRDGATTGGSQTILDTGVAANTSDALHFVIDWLSSTSCQCFIYDTDFDTSAPLYTSPVLTTDLIGTTRGLRVGVTSQYLISGTVPMFRFYKASLMNRGSTAL